MGTSKKVLILFIVILSMLFTQSSFVNSNVQKSNKTVYIVVSNRLVLSDIEQMPKTKKINK